MEIRNEFKRPKYIEETIVDRTTKSIVGTLRVFPSSVKWKPKRSRFLYSVPLSTFTRWIVKAGAKHKW